MPPPSKPEQPRGPDPSTTSIPVAGRGHVTALIYDAGRRAPVLVLAHGAGAGQRSGFMVQCAQALRARGVTAVTFDFPYMEAGRRTPDRPPVLEDAWRAVIDHLVAEGVAPGRLIIGGKSLGGRIASHVLSDPAHPQRTVTGLVLLGYPLHPPGRPEQRRVAHLPRLSTPTLVVQGSRDDFGSEDEVRQAFAVVAAPVDWHVVEGGDHSFKVRGGRVPSAQALEGIYDGVASWVHARK